MHKILVFIPTYNCEKQISRVLKQFHPPKIHALFSQILILDNRSQDDTLNAALNTAKELPEGKVVIGQNRHNIGLGGSHKNTFRYAKESGFSHIVVLHGDDQGCINDIVSILEDNAHEQNDCCLGARFHPGSCLKGYSMFRKLGNSVFNALFSIVTRKRIFDLGAGLNIYKTSAISDATIEFFSNDLTFNCYLLLFSIAKKQSIKFFPISWREDDQVSNVKLFHQAKNTLNLVLRYLIKGEPSLKIPDYLLSNDQKEFDVIPFTAGHHHD